MNRRTVDDLLDFVDVPEGSRVLDVGCRDGKLCFVLSGGRRFVIGVEPRRLEVPFSDRFVCGAIEQLPFRTSAFDIAFCRSRFGDSDDPEALLSEMVRVVRPGGLLVIEDDVSGGEPFRRTLSEAELCAHFAGERLEMVAARVAERGGSRVVAWLLRTPPPEKDVQRTYIQEDR